jgi:hypothetical protein
MSGDFDTRQGRRESVSASIEILLSMAAGSDRYYCDRHRIPFDRNQQLSALRRRDGTAVDAACDPLHSTLAFRAKQRRHAQSHLPA